MEGSIPDPNPHGLKGKSLASSSRGYVQLRIYIAAAIPVPSTPPPFFPPFYIPANGRVPALSVRLSGGARGFPVCKDALHNLGYSEPTTTAGARERFLDRDVTFFVNHPSTAGRAAVSSPTRHACLSHLLSRGGWSPPLACGGTPRFRVCF